MTGCGEIDEAALTPKTLIQGRNAVHAGFKQRGSCGGRRCSTTLVCMFVA